MLTLSPDLCAVAFVFLIWNVAVFYILVSGMVAIENEGNISILTMRIAMNMDARDVTVNWFTPVSSLSASNQFYAFSAQY